DVVRRIEGVDASWVKPSPGTGDPAPVFVVGMLRSGTTLVERILASHPRVHGLGEISWFSDNIGRMSRMTGQTFPEMLANLNEADASGLREAYTRRWPKDSQPVYFVDKFPINFVYLGLLVRIFPGARIVHCRRDARDTALSIYFQNFAHPMHSYAYDLADIGQYYNGYARVMRHWD